MNKILSLLFFMLLSQLLLACSLISMDSDEQQVNPASKIVASSRLYLSSSLMNRHEFEQYSLSDSAIFFECGFIKSNKPRVQSSFILKISESEHEELALGILEVIGIASVNSKLNKNDLKGKSNQATLNMTTVDGKNAELALSFKQVLMGKKELEMKYSQLISSFRAIIKSEKSEEDYCDNDHFYGLE